MRSETERTGYCSEGKREQIERTDCGWGRRESKKTRKMVGGEE